MDEVFQGSVAPEATAPATVVDTQAPDSAAEGDAGELASPKPERSEVPRSVINRIGHLTRKNETAIREAAQWKERAESLERQYAGQQQPQQREPQFDPQKVMAEARQAAAFDLRCNAVAEKGKTVPGFTDALSNLGMIGLDQAGLEVLIDSDDAPKVIAHLGQHLDEAAEIFAKPPAQMARAIAKLEQSLTQQPAVSNAPKPLQAERGGGTGSGPRVGTPQWFEARNKADAERRKR